jgi:hypothetical protein
MELAAASGYPARTGAERPGQRITERVGRIGGDQEDATPGLDGRQRG